MRNLLLLVGALLLSAGASAHDRCDQKAIRKAIAQVRNSKEAQAYALHSHDKIPRTARENLMRVFKKVETAVFAKSTLRIQEDLPAIPPMSTFNSQAGIITISPQTLDSLNQKLAQPTDGAAFIVAHEIGHFVQNNFMAHDSKSLSPDGFKNSKPEDDVDFNNLHAETDCIAVEIYHQAGFPITEDIFKTLQIIKGECKSQREEAFCNAADEIRQSTVRTYIQKYFTNPSQKPELTSPNSHKISAPKVEANSAK